MADNSAKGPVSGLLGAMTRAGSFDLSPIFQESASGWFYAQRAKFVIVPYKGYERVVFSDSQGLYVREGNRRSYLEPSPEMRQQMEKNAIAPSLPVKFSDPLALLTTEAQIFDDYLKARPLKSSAVAATADIGKPRHAFQAAALGHHLDIAAPAPLPSAPAPSPSPDEAMA
jgi:hypothetical protein